MAAFIELGVIIALFGLIIWAIRKGKNQQPGDKKRPD